MSQKSISILLAIVMVFISFSINAVEEYRIIINKNDKELVVKKSNTIIKKYHIATGKGGKGTKRERGDSKTPLGVYRVTKLKKSSRFHYFIQLSYPNLIDAWYGFKNEVIDGADFKRIAGAYKKREFPPQDTKLGGQIGIHGIGRITKQKLAIHKDLNWTDGCIALTNHDINELKQYVNIGTVVVINE
tara:strand:+ start:1888 stop:2451 length:564 start_codon:yes stop_codon:yes gene_type:complete